MTSRDDMVIRPRLKAPGRADEPVRARARRGAGRARRRRGILRRLVRAAAARRAIKRIGRSLVARGIGKAGLGGVGRLVKSPAGALAAGVVAAVAVAVRLGTGKSFGTIGEDINEALLGRADDEARAKARVRAFLMSDEPLMQMVGAELFATGKRLGGPGDEVPDDVAHLFARLNPQVAAIGENLYRRFLAEEVGASIIRRDPRFQTQGALDMVVLRSRDLVVDGWRESGGEDAWRSVIDSAKKVMGF